MSVNRRHCTNCKDDVLTSNQRCSWCDRDLGPVPREPVIAWNMQRALEATTLMHLTEPKP